MRLEAWALAAAFLVGPGGRGAAAYVESSNAVAVSPDGAIVAAVNPDGGSVSIVDAKTSRLLREIPVGKDPRALAFTPDSRRLLVSDYGSSDVTLVDVGDPRHVHAERIRVGPMPYGVATDGTSAFVAEFALGNVAVVDLARRAVVRRIPVEPFPAGLAIKPGTSGHGGILLVTHFLTGRVSRIDLGDLTVRGVASPGEDANLAQFVSISSDGTKAYLPQTRPNADNRALTFDTTVFPEVRVLDLAGWTFSPRERINLGVAARPVNLPFAAVPSPEGDRLYVANAGSDDLSVVGLPAGREIAQIRVGANPRGVAVAPDGARVYVDNVLDGTLSVIDARTLTLKGVVRLTTIKLPARVLLGKKLFNSSTDPRLSLNRWLSCATCHPDGGMDGRTWRGFPDGPRNTPALFGAAQTGPYHWSGDLSELQDVELTIRAVQFGTGLAAGDVHDSLREPYAGLSPDLDALADYLSSLAAEPSPYVLDKGGRARGEAVFRAQGCQACHPAPLFTDRLTHDVGTGDPSQERNSHGRGTRFDTPSLRGLWRTAPYMHDGSAATLEAALRLGAPHDALTRLSVDERTALLDYLRALP